MDVPRRMMRLRWLSRRTEALYISPLRTLGASYATAAKKGGKKEQGKYQATLRLPQTPFSLRAFAKDREPRFRKATTENLYEWQRRHLGGDQRDFVLHDGPPYANGSLHMGHALNKILKDIILRFQVLQGRRVHYMPGWDCHGLPIEIKAVAEARAQGQTSMTPTQIRDTARKVALRELDNQREMFKQFGIMTDWSDSNCYRTLSFSYELAQLRLFAKCVERGLIYERFRPVYWSPSTQTALAEAEIEYDEHVSHSVYLRFRLEPSTSLRTLLGTLAEEPISMVVWTTTPWSLFGNMALTIKADAVYSIVRTSTNELLLVAQDLVSSLSSVSLGRDTKAPRTHLGALDEVLTLPGTALVGSTYRYPFMAPDAVRYITAADFVTTESGTGIVHSAPAHGQEDYEAWRDSGCLESYGITSPVDHRGAFAFDSKHGATPAIQDDIQSLEGLLALEEGTKKVLELLDKYGILLGEQLYTHSYPIDWRTKKPILTRATAQWFADLSQTLPDTNAALRDVHFVPPTGEHRLHSLVSRRSEWCISRQRAWGVPIPVVYDAETHTPLVSVDNVEHIIDVMASHGSTDAWWTLDAEAFVAPAHRVPGKSWYIKGDTLDVWFDSGSSWAVLQQALGEPLCTSEPCADVYLEGSDQHRGWFQSSLLTRVAVCGHGTKAPYANLVTHGFVVDESGRKMSKSIGNVIAPEAFLQGDPKKPKEFPALGTDVLRWWVAKADYTKDIPISTLIMKHVSDEVRKLRNTARFMLANLNDLPRESIPPLSPSTASLMDRYTMHELYKLERTCREAYRQFDFAQVTRSLLEFATKTLSSLYLDIVKDPLYAGSEADRQGILYVLDHVLHTMTTLLAPILPHLAEDIAWYRRGAQADPTPAEMETMPSFFQQGWRPVDVVWHDPALEAQAQALLRMRSDIFVLMTHCQKAGHIKASSETAVDIYLPSSHPLWAVCEAHQAQLPDLFQVSHVRLFPEEAAFHAHLRADRWSQSLTIHNTPIQLRMQASPQHKCPRCWKYHSDQPETLCARCDAVLSP